MLSEKENMFHEEKVINCVLCWRGTPDGEWTQYTPEALTVALNSARSTNQGANLRAELEKLAGELNRMRARVEGVLWPNNGMARDG